MTVSRLLRISRQRLRSLSQRDVVDAEVQREFGFHFEQLVREYAAEGMPPDEARQAARRALGNVALLEEECRDQRRVAWLHDLWQDLLYGLRMLRQNPGFTAIAAMSLALGIGANTAVLTAIDSVLKGPLPFVREERLVNIRTFPLAYPGQNNQASLPDYFAWRERTRSFEIMGASLSDQKYLGETEDGAAPERLLGKGFSAELFRTLGIRPMLGRVFTEADYRADPPSVVIIGNSLWRRRFAEDPNILGKNIRLNGAPMKIIGVMPEYFPYLEVGIEYWIPMALDRRPTENSARFFIVTARLKDGVSIQQAQSEMDAIALQLANDFPDRHQGWGIRVLPLRETLFGWTRQPLLILETAVLLVLLIACANVAGLLLARGSVRRQELAMRVALGAGRGRIIRQLLTESVLLSLIGGLVGLLAAWWGLSGISTITPPPGAPRLAEISLSYRMLGLTALISVATGLIFGVVPAFASFKPDLAGTLQQSSRAAGTHAGRHRLRGILVAGQIALALVLLIGSGLMLKSFLRLTGRDLNFDPKGLLSIEYRIPQQLYMHEIGSYRDSRYFEIRPAPSLTIERIYQRLRELPGATSVAGISHPPVNSLIVPSMSVIVERREVEGKETLNSSYFLVTPNFFSTMKAQLFRGRDFDARDTASAPWRAVVNETAARRFWPGEDPIGKRFTVDTVPEEKPREVIGVIRDIPTRTRQITLEPVIYASYLQQPSRAGPWGNMFGQMIFVLRSSGDPLSLAPAARRAVAEIDPDHPLATVATVEGYLYARLPEFSYYVLMVGTFGLVATVLAAIGIYGVMAYSVAQRTQEIGIRMALGASGREVIQLVARRSLVLIGIGVAAGLAGSLALTRLIASQLWGVAPTDPATFVAVTVLLVLVALLACFVPARRAIAVDPTVALRSE